MVFTIRNGLPEFVYPAVNLRRRGGWGDLDVEQGLTARGLRFEMRKPLQTWRIVLQGRNSVDLEWDAFTPPYDYAESAGHGPPEIAGSHFEQSGTVRGITRLKGVEIEIAEALVRVYRP